MTVWGMDVAIIITMLAIAIPVGGTPTLGSHTVRSPLKKLPYKHSSVNHEWGMDTMFVYGHGGMGMGGCRGGGGCMGPLFVMWDPYLGTPVWIPCPWVFF